jgi:hypothetical protein
MAQVIYIYLEDVKATDAALYQRLVKHYGTSVGDIAINVDNPSIPPHLTVDVKRDGGTITSLTRLHHPPSRP